LSSADERPTDGPAGHRPSVQGPVSFGPFHLSPSERLLENDGAAISIGSRALDILIVLVERAGEIVSGRELIQRVWPTTTASEASLRVQMTALRRALGNGGDRYVANVPGRGYCLTLPVVVSSTSSVFPVSDADGGLPQPPLRFIGRDAAVREISADLEARRFVTVVGQGGVGKTTVAVQVSYGLLGSYENQVRFIDLGALTDPSLVPAAVLSALGLSPTNAGNFLARVISFTSGKRLLLVLDSCEHVIAAVSDLAEQLFRHADNITIFATSRESLRVEGEHVYRLAPLEYPSVDHLPMAKEASGFSAVRLFVECVAASARDFELAEDDVAAAAEICSRLDGIPLAIEIAAGRVEAYGIQGTAASLGDRLVLMWSGRRTAPIRHRTINAALDWSYGLLPDFEQRVLRVLSVFVGPFTLEAALEIIADDRAEVGDAIASLVAKSLVSSIVQARSRGFRLNQTARGYALGRLGEAGEVAMYARRHAIYFSRLLADLNRDARISSTVDAVSVYGDHLNNVRAALEWCFGPVGDADLGASLAADAAPLFLELSYLSECRSWMGRTLDNVPGIALKPRVEMHIHAALGVSAMFTQGAGPAVQSAFERGLQLAEDLGDTVYEMGLLGMLNIYYQRVGDRQKALEIARQAESVARSLNDPNAKMLAQWTLGVSVYQSGDLTEARACCETALLDPPASGNSKFLRFLGYDHRIRALATAALSLWLNGFPDRAVEAAELGVLEAERLGQTISLCVAYFCSACVLSWVGDTAAAERAIDKVLDYTARHSLLPYYAAALGLRGLMQINRNNPELAILTLQDSLATLERERYAIMMPPIWSYLARGLRMIGRFDEARETIEKALYQCTASGDLFAIPDMLRVKSEILACGPTPDMTEAEQCFQAALTGARRQSALSWELRTVMALGEFWTATGRRTEALALVQSVYSRFTEGFGTSDLRKAKLLLERLAT
jgi:predicted ATPase/DNA-binding winged helix-turn-helix (wHTH) protein